MRRVLGEEEEIPRKGFWRHQFGPVPTAKQDLFDGIFGVILPVVCLVADPIVFKGGFLDPWLDNFQVLAYLTSTIEIAVFIVWRTFRKQLITVSAPFAGILF